MINEESILGQWIQDNRNALEEEFIFDNQAEFNNWCLISSKEMDCPDAMDEFIELNNDQFWEYAKEQAHVAWDIYGI